MKTENFKLAPLEKALASLEEAIHTPKKDNFVRDATIQRFEYSYELSWKFLKRYLKEFVGIEEHQIKQIYREASKIKLIENPEVWFSYHEARNLTVHTYNEDVAEETYEAAVKFYHDANKLLSEFKKRT